MTNTHVETMNGSFLTLSVELLKLGIHNHKFFLMLNDTTLKGIDPHSPNLSEEMKDRIFNECRNNFWYYLREVYRVPVPGSDITTQFILHKGNLAMLFLALNDISVYAELPRQTGLTVAAHALASWEMLFSEKKQYVLTGEMADANLQLEKIHAAINALPEYIRSHRTLLLKELLLTDRLDHHVIEGVGNRNSEEKISNMYRVKTYDTIIMDNFASLKHNKIILGESSGVRKIILSQIGEFESEEEEYAKEVIENAIPFHETFYDQHIVNLQHIINHTAPGNGIVYVKYDFMNINATEDLFEAMCELLNYDVDKINKELLLIRQYTPKQEAQKKLRDLKVSRELQERFKAKIKE